MSRVAELDSLGSSERTPAPLQDAIQKLRLLSDDQLQAAVQQLAVTQASGQVQQVLMSEIRGQHEGGSDVGSSTQTEDR